MRGCFVVAAIALALTVASAQTKSIPPGTASIAGRVVAADTKRPLADAVVTLRQLSGQGVLQTLTDADGRYAFEGIAAALYRVSAFVEGYAAAEAPSGSFAPFAGSSVAFATDGAIQRSVELALAPGATIMGRVTNDAGQPVKDGIMIAWRADERGGFSPNGVTQVRTNERGEYTIRNLPAGRYRLSVMWIDPAMRKVNATADASPTYFPGTREAHEAMSLTLSPGGQLRGIDIRLLPSNLYRFAGYVLRGASEGRIEALVLLPGLSIRTVTIAEDDGAFEITHLKPGPLTFWARATTDDGSEAAWIEADLDTDTVGTILPLEPTAEIRGRVVMHDGTAVPAGLQVVANIVDRTGAQIDPLPRDRVDVEDDGTFRLRGVFGHRTLTVVGLTHEHVLDRVLQGNAEIKMLTLSPRELVNEVSLVVRRRD